jgi:hypothetical protein
MTLVTVWRGNFDTGREQGIFKKNILFLFWMFVIMVCSVCENSAISLLSEVFHRFVLFQ